MSGFEDMELWTEEELLRESRDGNSDAFVLFCTRVVPSLKRYVEFRCAANKIPPDLVDDFCQDTLMRAVEHIHTSAAAPEYPVAWLKRIASNLIVDWTRRADRVTYADPTTINPVDEWAPTTSDEEELDELLKFFSWLPPDEHDLLEMVHMQGMTVVDAGALLNLSKWSAYKKFERGTQLLQDLLERHGKVSTDVRRRT